MSTLEKLVLGASTLVFLSGCSSYEVSFPGNVLLSPENPVSDDSLFCWVDSKEQSSFDFYWFVNREVVQTQTGHMAYLPSWYTTQGDSVLCSVWTASSGEYTAAEYGYALAHIE